MIHHDILLFGYHLVSCQLALRCSQDIDLSCHGSDDLTIFGYDFKRVYVFDVSAPTSGPRLVPSLSFMFPAIKLSGFERYSSPAFRAMNLSGSSSAVIEAWLAVLKWLSFMLRCCKTLSCCLREMLDRPKMLMLSSRGYKRSREC